VEITESTTSSGADFVIEVTAVPGARTHSTVGGPRAVVREDKVELGDPIRDWWGNQFQDIRQIAAVHEFGHLIGQYHPGHYCDPPIEDDDMEYKIDAPALMGDGMEMRARYFELWQAELDRELDPFGPFTTRKAPTGPSTKSAELERDGL
jgi:hypothetical protein